MEIIPECAKTGIRWNASWFAGLTNDWVGTIEEMRGCAASELAGEVARLNIDPTWVL